ncbi:MAG: putative membrane protein [Mariniblastus sp.]|jgi:putative membrane protein
MNREKYTQQAPNLALGKKLTIVTCVLTVAVWLLVGMMRSPAKIPLPAGVSLAFLPLVHAILNSLVAMFLVVALVLIKRNNVAGHKRAISAAMLCSAGFLLCYVAYHFTTPETKFGGVGAVKVCYLLLLISHIVLAAISLPFILLTWVYGFTNQFQRHRRLARWVFPVWLYVAVTGPICYLMLRPYYEF